MTVIHVVASVLDAYYAHSAAMNKSICFCYDAGVIRQSDPFIVMVTLNRSNCSQFVL